MLYQAAMQVQEWLREIYTEYYSWHEVRACVHPTMANMIACELAASPYYREGLDVAYHYVREQVLQDA